MNDETINVHYVYGTVSSRNSRKSEFCFLDYPEINMDMSLENRGAFHPCETLFNDTVDDDYISTFDDAECTRARFDA
jgi:hypothetical protein